LDDIHSPQQPSGDHEALELMIMGILPRNILPSHRARLLILKHGSHTSQEDDQRLPNTMAMGQIYAEATVRTFDQSDSKY
jgi:hypothetical protein